MTTIALLGLLCGCSYYSARSFLRQNAKKIVDTNSRDKCLGRDKSSCKSAGCFWYRSCLVEGSDTWSDYDYVLAAVTANPSDLQHASADLKDNIDIVVAAMKHPNGGYYLKLASDRLRDNFDLGLQGVKTWSAIYADLSERLKGNVQIAATAAMNNGQMLYYAPASIKDNHDVILASCSGTFNCGFRFASDARKNDRDLVLKAVQFKGSEMYYVPEKFRSDPEIVTTAVMTYGDALQYASADLKSKPGLVMTAVNQHGLALQYAAQEVQADRTVVLTAIRQSGLALQFASAALKNDRDIVLAAVLSDGSALFWASADLKDNKDMVMQAILHQNCHGSNCSPLHFASARLQDNRDIVMQSLERTAYSLQWASDNLKNDFALVKYAVQQQGGVLRYASAAMKDNFEIVMAAVNNDPLALEYVSADMKANREIVQAAVNKNGCARKFAAQNIPGVTWGTCVVHHYGHR